MRVGHYNATRPGNNVDGPWLESITPIHAEMTAVEGGTADAANNVLKNAPHTATAIAGDQWELHGVYS